MEKSSSFLSSYHAFRDPDVCCGPHFYAVWCGLLKQPMSLLREFTCIGKEAEQPYALARLGSMARRLCGGGLTCIRRWAFEDIWANCEANLNIGALFHKLQCKSQTYEDEVNLGAAHLFLPTNRRQTEVGWTALTLGQSFRSFPQNVKSVRKKPFF